jgi:hypothetical protein
VRLGDRDRGGARVGSVGAFRWYASLSLHVSGTYTCKEVHSSVSRATRGNLAALSFVSSYLLLCPIVTIWLCSQAGFRLVLRVTWLRHRTHLISVRGKRMQRYEMGKAGEPCPGVPHRVTMWRLSEWRCRPGVRPYSWNILISTSVNHHR